MLKQIILVFVSKTDLEIEFYPKTNNIWPRVRKVLQGQPGSPKKRVYIPTYNYNNRKICFVLFYSLSLYVFNMCDKVINDNSFKFLFKYKHTFSHEFNLNRHNTVLCINVSFISENQFPLFAVNTLAGACEQSMCQHNTLVVVVCYAVYYYFLLYGEWYIIIIYYEFIFNSLEIHTGNT